MKAPYITLSCQTTSRKSDKVCLFQGARVWIPHTELVWEGAEVEEDYVSKTIKVKTEDGTVSILSILITKNFFSNKCGSL